MGADRREIFLIAIASTVLLVLLTVVTWWRLEVRHHEVLEENARQNAQTYLRILEQFRTVYTSEVVDRVGDRVPVTHDYLSQEGAIPLPATLSMMLVQELGSPSDGISARLFSRYPFPWRIEAGQLDDFEQRALAAIEADPEILFTTVDERPDGRYLRVAKADLMRASCVGCHNTHPDSPKADWRTGDVRGVLEVSVPLGDAGVVVAEEAWELLIIYVFTITLFGVVVYQFLGRPAIRERQQAAIALRERERQFRLLAENLPGMVYLCKHDDRHTMLYLNDEVETLTGYSKEAFLEGRRSIVDLYHPADVDAIEEATARAVQTRSPFHHEYRLRRRSGEWAWVEEFGAGIYDETTGELLFLEGFCRDVTKQILAEQFQRQVEARIQETQKLESLGLMAGGIAHDFNNLLVGILGNADLVLADLNPSSPEQPLVRDIRVAAQRAAELTHQMLAYTGKNLIELVPLDLTELVRESTQLVETVISKKATLHFELDELPAVEGDATQLRQLVMNLITNASDALGDAAGDITVRTGVVEVDDVYLATTHRLEDLVEGPYAFVEVTDTGCGMDEETVSKIFDPFFTTKFTGRGLGLAAAMGIVRSHQGALEVLSEPGQGTTFTILLPCSDANVPAAAPNPHPGAPTPKHEGVVLVVDDEATVRNVAVRALERAGYSTLTAADGQAAIDVFRDHKSVISAVLLDVTMPRMGGEDALRQLQRIRADVPVVLCSGYTESDLAATLSANGMAGFLHKPYTASSLVAMIRDVTRAPD